jgi:ABC-2 type transport system permease protein
MSSNYTQVPVMDNAAVEPPVRNVSENIAATPWQNIWNIAKREISAKFAQRSFMIMTLVMLLTTVGGIFAVQHFAQGESRINVGVLDPAATPTIATVAEAAGMNVDILPPYPTLEAATEAIRSGEVAAVVVGNPMLDEQVQVVTDSTLNPNLRALFTQIAQQAAFAREITALGGDPATVAAGLAATEISVTPLNPPPPTDAGQLIVAMVMGILLYMAMLMGGQYVAQGVVEEKASRVVEVLLSTVRPWQLLAGKVLGIGIITLGQLFLILGAAFAAARFTGVLQLTNVAFGRTLIWSIIWALVGYITFSVIMAAMASLVSRQEEVGSVITPVIMLMMIPYIIGVSILPHDPTNQLGSILSFIPLMSAMLMPIRVALGAVSTPQVLLSLLISLVALPVFLWIASKIYTGAILHTGGRLKMRDALGSAR